MSKEKVQFIGREPVDGTPVQMNLVLASKDVVAADSTGCRVMGIDPHTISHIQRAYEKKLGNIDDIKVLGEKIETVTRVFKRS